MSMALTDEQELAREKFQTGDSLKIEAGAGTGKTSTLVALAHSAPNRLGAYVAFNKAIVVEAQRKFPGTVTCKTAHSHAFGAVGRTYAHRLNGTRMRSEQVARHLAIGPMFITGLDGERKALQPGYLANLTMRMVRGFCQSADTEITSRHLGYVEGLDKATDEGRRGYANNDSVARALVPYARRMWADISNVGGNLPFTHDHYLKLWGLSNPRIHADYLLVDEAQDLNPVLAGIIAAQEHAQVVYVGDSQQQIYEFTGAVNAMARVETAHRTFLTRSFRFGPEIAEVANAVLAKLGAELRLTGAGKPGTVAPMERPGAVLTRTNGQAVSTMLMVMAEGRRPHLIGGGEDVVKFARAAEDMKAGRPTLHPDLSIFDTWAAVQDYVDHDEGGSDLKLLVTLVDRFGADVIRDALERMPEERHADLVISTAHKAKGREWDAVQLAGDFNPPRRGDEPARELGDSDLRLLYVSVTRARLALDGSRVEALSEALNPQPAPVAPPEEKPAVTRPVGPTLGWVSTQGRSRHDQEPERPRGGKGAREVAARAGRRTTRSAA